MKVINKPRHRHNPFRLIACCTVLLSVWESLLLLCNHGQPDSCIVHVVAVVTPMPVSSYVTRIAPDPQPQMYTRPRERSETRHPSSGFVPGIAIDRAYTTERVEHYSAWPCRTRALLSMSWSQQPHGLFFPIFSKGMIFVLETDNNRNSGNRDVMIVHKYA